MNPVFYVDVSIEGCDAEVFLNDAPIVRITPDSSSMAFPTVSQWAINGENELTVVVAAAASGGNEPRVKATLTSGEAGGFPEPGSGQVYAAIDETPEASGTDIRYSARGALEHSWGAWSWQSAPAIALDEATQADLTNFLKTLHGALSQRRLEPLLDACETMFEEVGRCYGMSAADARAQMQGGVGYISSNPEWSLAPLDPADLVFRSCCGGRVVQPLTRDGQPALRQAAPIDGQSWSLPMFVARTGAGYGIVR